ncbi:MAG: DUF3008 family protein [Bauldia sp.]
MPAKSRAQQMAAGSALSARRGETIGDWHRGSLQRTIDSPLTFGFRSTSMS